MKTMTRITSKGQVTIPREIRERFGLLPHTLVEFVVTPEGPRLIRAREGQTRGARIVARMRQSRRKLRFTTDEVMRLTRGED
jgi:AbrB family looped-hinge helix DNA binding protein